MLRFNYLRRCRQLQYIQKRSFRYTSLLRNENITKEGSVIHGWRVTKVQQIPEFKFMTYQLEHEKTGAKYFHIDANDSNNCFAISFPTPPTNSKGIPHVLEHTVLCGSKKYPVRDPFFNMIKRSLNTYMNAWTASDHTTYPFSSQNKKDFYNLMSVYLDATLFPNLRQSDFKQEGHRLEFENMNDPNSPLQIKGIVYNEMKGAMGDPSQLFMYYLQNKTYPGTPYEYNSGGDPSEIPEMTYEELREFHATHYHPSNALIFTYGNFPFIDHLKFLNENGFDQFERIEKIPPIEKAKRYTSPQRFEVTGPPDPMTQNPTKEIKIATSFLIDTNQDPFETFVMRLLCNSILLDEPRGPFYKALIESGLGSDFAPGSGIDTTLKEPHFVVGVQGIGEEDIEKVERTITETFEKIVKEGIDPALTESAIHSVELAIKAKSPNFGISIAHGLIARWLHTGDPTDALFINEKIERLREELKKGKYFESLIEKYFLKNQHKVTVIMRPDEEHAQKETQKELERIKEISSKLTDVKKQKIIEEAELLQKLQSKEQDKSCLPTLTLEDIQRKLPEPINLVTSQISDEIQFNQQDTNGITYITTLTELPEDFPDELKPYIPLFTHVLTKLGARDMDHNKLAEEIELHTGGFEVQPVIIPDLKELNKVRIGIRITSLSLERNIDKMLDILAAIYTDPKLEDNTSLLSTLIEQSVVTLSNSIMDYGHRYAMIHSASTISRAGAINEQYSGLAYINLLNELLREDIHETAKKLQQIAGIILSKKNLKILLTTEKDLFQKSEKAIDRFLSQITKEGNNAQILKDAFNGESKNTFISIPSTVNFTATSIVTVPYAHPENAVLRIAANIMNSNYLHKEIRESGGAYGSGARQSMAGTFSFYAYRDPQTIRTLQIFREAPDWLSKNNFSEKDIDEAKLQVFQGLDHPLNPHDKAMNHFLYGITNELLQERRNIILDTSRADILDIVYKYLDIGRQKLNASTILGDLSKCPEQIKNSKEWTIVDPNESESIEEEEQ